MSRISYAEVLTDAAADYDRLAAFLETLGIPQVGKSTFRDYKPALYELARRLEQLPEIAERLLAYRQHDTHCSWHKTEFCDCGMKEAADAMRAMVAALQAGFDPEGTP